MPRLRFPRLSRLAAIAVVGLLSACAAQPTTQTQTSPAATPRRADLIAAARAEWTFFGRQQIDMRRAPFSAPRLGLLEDEGPAVQRIARYWQSVGRNWTGADCQQPWSAAFISYLMQRAGVSPDDFAPDETHFTYLSFLKARETRPAPLFVLRPAAVEPVAPGDLICKSRDSNDVTSIDDIRPGLPGHCDLIVEVHRWRGWAGAIGGNVFNSVSESLLPLDGTGHVIATPDHRWFVVVKNLMR